MTRTEIRRVARAVLRAARAQVERVRQYRYYGRSPTDVFGEIYHRRAWGDPESASGSGSNLRQTEVLRETLPKLLARHGVKTMLDAPCGDYHWMAQVELGVKRYIGADIVPELVEANRARYANERVSFVQLDLTKDRLPSADLVLCRDCLVHLSYEHAFAALRNIARSDVDWLLTTTFTTRENADIVTGSWRPINLQRRPFDLAPPVELLAENCTESDGLHADKSLALWRVRDLRERFGR